MIEDAHPFGMFQNLPDQYEDERARFVLGQDNRIEVHHPEHPTLVFNEKTNTFEEMKK